MPKSTRAYGVNSDVRFKLHHRLPRSDKLDVRQRQICCADPAYAEALRQRVSNMGRFAAFLEGLSYYRDINRQCVKCQGFMRRTRDRSCYTCHLARTGANFERMRAGLAPIVKRSRASHLDLLAREKAERQDKYTTFEKAGIKAKLWPTGKLEINFHGGYIERDFSKLGWQDCMDALEKYSDLREVLRWAGWAVD